MGREVPDDRAQLADCLEQVVPFFAISQPIRRAIYTTNAIESLNNTVAAGGASAQAAALC